MDSAADRYPDSLRDGLPRDEGYPLSRSELDAVLLAHDVGRLDLIYFLRGGQRWADHTGEVVGVRYLADRPERLELRVFSVPVRLKTTIRSALRGGGIEQVAAWIAATGRSETPWRSTDHALTLRWERGALCHAEFDGVRARSVY
jgi:hypothetical protein